MDPYERALDALGDPTRRAVFERLRAGACSVGELADGLPVSRPAVSQHLRMLAHAGLVMSRPDGTRRLYAVDPTAVAELRDYFERFWQEAVEGFKRGSGSARRDAAEAARGARGRSRPRGREL